MNKSIMIGGGIIALGLFLAVKAKKKGKEVPFIGRFIPANPTPAPETEMSNAIGGTLSRVGSGVKYGASACAHPTNKIYTVCGQTCPNGHTKVSGAHKAGC